MKVANRGVLLSKELLELMQRTRVRKYSSDDPKQVIQGIVEEIKVKTGHYGFRSWEMMVEYLGKWLVLNQKIGLACMPPLQGFKGLNLQKDALYEHLEELDYFRHYYTAAKANPWDHIGEVYTEMELAGPGQNMTPRTIVEFMTKMVYVGKRLDGADEWFCYDSYLRYVTWYCLTYHVLPNHLRPMNPPVKTQLDPCVGSGRFLLAASLMMPKANLVLFGIEINPSLYRACLVNMAMFSNHPFSIICADALMIDPKYSGPSSSLWDMGNRWNPPDISVFYWKPPPINPESFSLKAFTEIKENK